jgi:hypothetical protein
MFYELTHSGERESLRVLDISVFANGNMSRREYLTRHTYNYLTESNVSVNVHWSEGVLVLQISRLQFRNRTA